MAKKWLDCIEKQRRRIDLKERYRQTDIHTYRQSQRQKNSRLLAGAESTETERELTHGWAGVYLLSVREN